MEAPSKDQGLILLKIATVHGVLQPLQRESLRRSKRRVNSICSSWLRARWSVSLPPRQLCLADRRRGFPVGHLGGQRGWKLLIGYSAWFWSCGAQSRRAPAQLSCDRILRRDDHFFDFQFAGPNTCFGAALETFGGKGGWQRAGLYVVGLDWLWPC